MTAALRAPALARALAPLLPDRDGTLLLRALLLSGSAGRDAWHRWLAGSGDPRVLFAHERRGLKRLLPLLYAATARTGVAVEKDLLTYLRTAYAREKMRGAVYREGAHEALRALGAVGAPFVVLRGAALAELHYEDWALRHCHDLDLLLDPPRVDRAAAALVSAGFTRLDDDAARARGTVRMAHASGLPVELHTRLFAHPAYAVPFAELWRRRCHAVICGVDVATLSSADTLLHICGHASCSSSRATLRWVCDAALLIERTSALEWMQLVASARRWGVALPLSLALSYLRRELEVPVPEMALGALRRATSLRRVAACEAALYGLPIGGTRSLTLALDRRCDWRSRAILLKWALVPDPIYLRARSPLPARPVAMQYAARALRAVRSL